MSPRHILIIVILALLSACGSAPPSPESTASVSSAPSQAVPIEALNPDVHQDTIQQTICVAGYTASVRPSTTYTNGVKLKLLREHALPASAASEYELDHRIPLALGGHPRNLQNLMLQPWDGKNGAKAKDRLERSLQRLVCSGKVLLDDARKAIYVDWQGAYGTYLGMAP